MTDNTLAAMRVPVDWSKSILGRELWMAWNRVDHAIHRMLSATPQHMTQAAAELQEARSAMLTALSNRDKIPL